MALGVGTLWAALAAMATSMALGMLYYGPVFGKAYMRLTGMDKLDPEAKKRAQKEATPGYISSLVTVGAATVLVAFLFDWSFEGSGYASQPMFGVALGTAGWLAFYVPGTFTNQFFLLDRPPTGLWWINAGYWFFIAVLTGLYVGLFA